MYRKKWFSSFLLLILLFSFSALADFDLSLFENSHYTINNENGKIIIAPTAPAQTNEVADKTTNITLFSFLYGNEADPFSLSLEFFIGGTELFKPTKVLFSTETSTYLLEPTFLNFSLTDGENSVAEFATFLLGNQGLEMLEDLTTAQASSFTIIGEEKTIEENFSLEMLQVIENIYSTYQKAADFTSPQYSKHLETLNKTYPIIKESN